MSLASRPGNFGTIFHNYLYQTLNLDFIYKAFTTNNLGDSIRGIKSLGIRGCAISMPYKEDCIQYLDELDISAKTIQSVNTIVNTDGYLKGYNTDYIAVKKLLLENKIPTLTSYVVNGSGGMAKAVLGALTDNGYNNGFIVARNESKAKKMETLYGCKYLQNSDKIDARLIINATPLGMSGGSGSELLSFSKEIISQADIIFDVVATPVQTPLINEAISQCKRIISGADVAIIQSLEQFVLYTDIRPTKEIINRATTYTRNKIDELTQEKDNE